MLPAPIPSNEDERLAALDKLDLLYAPPEKSFDRITAELARIFEVPVATISVIDRETQFYVSQVGLPLEIAGSRVFPRALSLCGHVVGNNEAMIVEDLAKDPRFADNPFISEAGARFYAGVPIRSDEGLPVGSLCIGDFRPRTLEPREEQLLQLLAHEVMTEVKLLGLSRELRGISDRLSKRNIAVERELREARIVQEFLLPPAQQRGPGFDICHTYHPFDHIGGDFIDVHLRKDGSVVLLLADVSGHGASAALTSAMTKTCFHRSAANAREPGEVLTAINADLGEIAPVGRFMTAVAAIYEPFNGGVTLASAGHPYPFILRGSGSAPVMLKTPNEPPLLIDSDRSYKASMHVPLDAGDRLVLYTDGVIEAASPAGEFLAFDGLSRLLSAHGGLRGVEFLAALFGSICRFAGNHLADDVAIVSLDCARQ